MACQRIPENKIAKIVLEGTKSPLAWFSHVSNFLLKTSPLQCLALKIAGKMFCFYVTVLGLSSFL